ncbi:N-acetylmuramoyl-L-alanine amidase [Streptomyces sp. RKND-216]|uniref:N-acetylmuramoyl-L-alanine amidase n=1 Tax=Streptomyces sp. RKND-216 TaxID=2562581 RepID=UPI00109DE863|nr:N-acetylmuramoyl-L-alanine amidase [Streptomyces sp. RKND-216]THA26646.1 N-acetylmuramoyl-L-alanine amidase [Streptomyces sp. RKND-216]
MLALLVPLCLVAGLVWLTRDAGDGAGDPSEPGPGRTGVSPGPGARSPSPGATARKPLAGRTVVIDPGHNPANHRHPEKMAQQVDIGTGKKDCDTTGTATDQGYAEAAFTLDVSRRARTALERLGATVRLTQDGDRPWGPCIDERATIGNEAHADAVVSVHADGAGEGNRGFHVIAPRPVDEGKADTRGVAKPSERLGRALVAAFGEATGTRVSTYAGGGDGLVKRGDLGGLNLSRVPKVFLECGNMRDPRDAALLTDAAWRARAAQGVAQGVTAFLTGEQP